MDFNKTIPELSVFNIKESKNFYMDVLGSKIEYERSEDNFVFLSLEGNQLMLEEIHADGWNIGNLTYPLGQGINISLEVTDVVNLSRIKEHSISLYHDMTVSHKELMK